MNDSDLIAAFVELREDIDSVPFAHEDVWTVQAERVREVTP